MYPQQTRTAVLDKILSGYSHEQAGKPYGVSATTAIRWAREEGLKAVDHRYGKMTSGISWRTLERLERPGEMADNEATDKILLAWCGNEMKEVRTAGIPVCVGLNKVKRRAA